MHPIDLAILGAFAALLVFDAWRARSTANTGEGWLLAGRAMPWWAMGLSVMATQASAITLVGTTGKGFLDGTRFAQFYYSLPLAMLIIGVTVVPLFHRLRSYTAYEWLEDRAGRSARVAVASTFLVLRALSLGIVMMVPALILSSFSGWPYPLAVGVTAAIAVAYTAVSGLGAVIRTDVKQMALMVAALIGTFAVALGALPEGLGFAEVWQLGRETGRIVIADTSFDPSERYTLWSAFIGGTFLFLAYFGTDQSQVQRYLSGRSLEAKRGALTLNALAKIPLQGMILLLGVTLWVWSLADPAPLVFDPARAEALSELPGYDELKEQHANASVAAGAAAVAFAGAKSSAEAGERFREASAAVDSTRREVGALAKGAGLKDHSDANWIVPWFLVERLPAGLVGLLICAVLAAALSSIDSELGALATVTTVDLLRINPEDESGSRAAVRSARWCTLGYGVLAALFASTLRGAESVIELVNRVGSLFYGSLLGAFVLVALVRSARGPAVIAALLGGMGAVALAQNLKWGFLWLNPIGFGAALLVGVLVTWLSPRR